MTNKGTGIGNVIGSGIGRHHSGMTPREARKKTKAKRRLANIEVEKRISPLRGSQRREPLRSK
jgi:hypothetical protein